MMDWYHNEDEGWWLWIDDGFIYRATIWVEDGQFKWDVRVPDLWDGDGVWVNGGGCLDFDAAAAIVRGILAKHKYYFPKRNARFLAYLRRRAEAEKNRE